MPDRLYLRLAADGPLEWLAMADGRRVGGAAGDPPPAVIARAGTVIAFVPAEDVLLTEAKIGARNRAQLLQAIPFAVEDNLLGAVEDQHFAAATASGDAVGIAVVAKARLREWIARLAEAGVRADVVVPESLAVPLAGGHAGALVDRSRVIARFAPWSAFACASDDFATWLAQARAAGIEQPVDLHVGAGDARPPLPAGAQVEVQPEVTDRLAFLAAHLGTPPLNLLEGEFAGRHRQAGSTRWWRRSAALAAAMIVLAVLARGLEAG